MESIEIEAIREHIKFDKRSMALCLGVPYRTYQNYAYGINAIPDSIARKADELLQINITFMQDLPDRVQARIDREHPHGILSAPCNID